MPTLYIIKMWIKSIHLAGRHCNFGMNRTARFQLSLKNIWADNRNGGKPALRSRTIPMILLIVHQNNVTNTDAVLSHHSQLLIQINMPFITIWQRRRKKNMVAMKETAGAHISPHRLPSFSAPWATQKRKTSLLPSSIALPRDDAPACVPEV